MSMEHYVFSNQKLKSIAEWQAAIDAEQLGVRLDDSVIFNDMGGYLPATFEGENTGFECDHADAAELVEEFDLGGPWLHVLTFRYGGDARECRTAFLAAAAYAKATGGVLFESEGGETFATADVVDKARDIADPTKWVGI